MDQGYVQGQISLVDELIVNDLWIKQVLRPEWTNDGSLMYIGNYVIYSLMNKSR